MYHLYCHSPSALTEYLKQKLRTQRAKRLGRSLPAQVKQDVPLECNTTRHLIEFVALLTKSIGIVTPLILSIVVVVALRLILYRKDKNEPRDHIVHVEQPRSYRTWALMSGRDGKINNAVQCICVLSEVRSKRNRKSLFLSGMHFELVVCTKRPTVQRETSSYDLKTLETLKR